MGEIRATVRKFVTGDAYLAQHAMTKHFGLGSQTSVDAIEVQWPNGTMTRLEHPEINTYHTVGPGGGEQD